VTFRIRRATPADIAELARLIAASVRVLGSRYYTGEQIEEALEHIFGVDTQLIEDGTYYVAEAEGRIIGCGGWSKRRTLFGGDQAKRGADDSLLDPALEPARIRAFFVHPEWARKGVGARVLKTCEAAAGQEGFTRLELVATLPGEPLYTAAGYQVIERMDLPLPGGRRIAALRMGKEFEPSTEQNR
jgi:N-acetylglutamate synthase-like GNAT family acetyltransferase